MTVLQADLVSRQPWRLRPPESLADPADAAAADPPMPVTDSTTNAAEALARRVADAEAMLQHEKASADHAEQIMEAQN